MPGAGAGRACISLLRPALIRLTWAPGTEVRTEDADDVLERSLLVVDRVPYAILVDMRNIRSLDAGARASFAADRNVLAAAMLGSTPMDRVLAASAEQALHPARYFTVEALALSWLSGHLPDPDESLVGVRGEDCR